jgi:TolB protein
MARGKHWRRIAVSLLVLAGASALGRAPAGNRTVIAFVSDRDGNWEIDWMDSDGSGPPRLTQSKLERHYAPARSSDGTRIALVSARDGSEEVYVMNSDGSDPQRLTNEPQADTMPKWLPDGSKTIFSSARSGDSEIYIMDADGRSVVPLTDDRSEDASPAWRPG